MNLKALLVLLALLLWCAFCWYWWYYKICNCGAAAVAPITEAARRPLLYKWSDATTVTNKNFPAFKDSITALGAEGDTLVITGRYFKGETNTSPFANMGLARAHTAKTLFLDRYPDARIKLVAEEVGENANARNGLFESATFGYARFAPKGNETTIISDDNSALIYYPFNSSQKDVNPKVDAYIKSLAAKHQGTKAMFTVTGHTDNIGEDAPNMTLGQRRADGIKALLLKRGIANQRITAISKGESAPISTNDTEQGRQRNRRTEIQIAQ
jgi:OmpA-OmpF porin, OOP family